MREYKFRGKDLLEKWRYGDLVQEKWKSKLNANEKAFMIKKDKTAHTVLAETIGQYTGLKDKNGKEIYEGDIILTQPFRDKPYSKKHKEKRLKGIVKYNVKCSDNFYGCEGKMKYWGAEWSVEIIDKEDYKNFSNCDWGKFFECEVIGNIYDDKNLLEEGE